MPEYVGYVEVFFGGGSVFFNMPPRDGSINGDVCILNDINADLINFLRVVKDKRDELKKAYELIFPSRQIFFEYRADLAADNYGHFLSDVERAARWFYCLKNSLLGRGRVFVVDKGSQRRPRFNTQKIDETIDRAAEILNSRRALIERLPYQDLIEQYNNFREQLWYLDPPYFGYEGDYGGGIFYRRDHENLAAMLKNLKGKFILSINDTPEVRKIYGDFVLREVQTSYCLRNAGGVKQPSVQELIFMNYEPPRAELNIENFISAPALQA